MYDLEKRHISSFQNIVEDERRKCEEEIILDLQIPEEYKMIQRNKSRYLMI